MSEFLLRLLISAVLILAIKGGVALFHHSIAWWAAAVIALGVVFLGELLLPDGWS